MAIDAYTYTNLDSILNGEGDWFSAKLLRFLNDVLPHADRENLLHLMVAFPEEVELLTLEYYGWTKDQLNQRIGV